MSPPEPPFSLLDFTESRLAHALATVQTGGYQTAFPALGAYEKAVIYHYTYQGSAEIKDPVRAHDGATTEPLGQSLVAALRKLPPTSGWYIAPNFGRKPSCKTCSAGRPPAPTHFTLTKSAGLPFYPPVSLAEWPTTTYFTTEGVKIAACSSFPAPAASLMPSHIMGPTAVTPPPVSAKCYFYPIPVSGWCKCATQLRTGKSSY